MVIGIKIGYGFQCVIVIVLVSVFVIEFVIGFVIEFVIEFGIILGIVLGIAFGMSLGITLGTAFGSLLNIPFGKTLKYDLLCIVLEIAIGISFENKFCKVFGTDCGLNLASCL